MASFFILTKVLILKILLASLSGVSLSYEYGYHPSAEEFDKFVRESTRTWTRDLLANEHRRAWIDNNRDVRGRYVPKYNYESHRRKFENVNHAVSKPANDRHDQFHPVNNVFNNDNIATTLDFQLFSDELNVPISYQSTEQDNPMFDKTNVANNQIFNINKLLTNEHNGGTNDNVQSPMPQVNSNNVNFLTQNYQNKDNVSFPIFFKNPVTGIVYAITEIGKSENNTKPFNNDSIPIYITKEQYDRDIYLAHKYYKGLCTNMQDSQIELTTKSPVLSMPSQATLRPQIIRLQKPSKAFVKPTVAKLPTKLARPPPVMVRRNITINNQMHLPTTKRPVRKKKTKTKKKKRKKNKNVRPGSKPNTNSFKITTTQATLPIIVLGKPNQTAMSATLPTQVERPHAATTTTIFSQQPFVKSSGYMSSTTKKYRAKNEKSENKMLNDEEALELVSEEEKGKPADEVQEILQNLIKTTKQQQNEELPEIFQHLINTTTQQQQNNELPKYRIRRHAIDKIVANNLERAVDIGSNSSFNATTANKTKMWLKSNENSSTHTYLQLTPKSFQNTKPKPKSIKRPRTGSKKNSKRKPQRKPSNPTSSKQKTNINKLILPAILVGKSNSSTNGSDSITKVTTAAGKAVTKSKHRTNSKRKSGENESSESGFSLFDFFDANTDDGDDGDYDDYYDDNNDYDGNIQKPPAKLKKKNQKSNTSLKEDTPEYNDSSAEPDADFGALQEDEATTDYATIDNNAEYDEQNETNDNVGSLTKANTSKKRIRRRPAGEAANSQSDEEDYDGDDDFDDDSDSDDGSSFGNFFRMVFYPVQMVMSRIMDNFASEDVTTTTPTYTLYNNVVQPDNVVEYDENDDDPSNPLSNWFGSWFGYARKTKKIGSTTVAPVPKPTEQPGWFETLFNYINPKTTTESSAEDENEEKWFSSWFDTKPKAKSRRRTTTTTTAQTPQVPILTIVDPLKNPQNWIGILAHHIINSTTTSTHRPLIDAITEATRTTASTENQDQPHIVNYDKYQIWRLKPQDDSQVKALEDLKKSEDGIKLQWLKGPSLRGLTDVLVPPKMLIDLQGSLSFEAIGHEVLIFDVGKAIAYEKSKDTILLPTATQRPNKKANQLLSGQNAQPMSWHKYYEYDEIIKYLETLRMRYTQIVELIHIGRSYEGRPLVVVKLEAKQYDSNAGGAGNAAAAGINTNPHQRLKYKKKSGRANAVFVEAGVHGLEWIGPATATWMINELIRIMRSNKTTAEQKFIKQTTWYIMPVLNPDGYVYSHEYDRFWKKSRSRHLARPQNGILDTAMSWLQQRKRNSRVCYGVDLDRNWRYQWGKRGSSKSACNEFYAGPIAFSEPETKALADFLMEQRSQIKLYISMQAYGQLISFPLKANATFTSERMNDLLDVAMVGTDGLRRKGSNARYKIDSSNDLIEHRSGCSDAYAAYDVGIPFSYTLQLADNGVHGYLLPSSSITTTASDAFEIITSMLDYI